MKRRVGWLAQSALVCGLVMFAIPSAAMACKVNEGEHCYSIVWWNMQGSPAEIEGAYSVIDMYYGSVPNWKSENGFLDNEMWVAFPNDNSQAWVEAGATVGWPYSGTEPRGNRQSRA